MPDLPNVPVPDELAQVRADIKRLEERESELRRLLLKHEDLRSGNAWIAEIRVTTQQRTDIKELRASHPDLVAEYTFPVQIERIELSGLTDDGEIISARKMRNQSANTERQ